MFCRPQLIVKKSLQSYIEKNVYKRILDTNHDRELRRTELPMHFETKVYRYDYLATLKSK